MNAYVVRVPAADSDNIVSSRDAVERAIDRADKESSLRLNLDESWAALHFMLSGEVPFPRHEALSRGVAWRDTSFENVLMGGEPTEYRASFGPARYLSPEEVARLAAKLSALSVEDFLEAYDPDAMTRLGLPPEGWDDDSQTRDWLSDHFTKLVDFYKAAARSGDGMLVYMI